MPFDLRQYQLDVADRAADRVRSGLRRGIIQGSCGSGKTVIGCHLCKRSYDKGSRVLVLADRRKLVKQFAATLDAMGVPYGKIMSGETANTRDNIILGSRDTLLAWQEVGRDIPQFDMVICDEAHRSVSATTQALLALYPQAVVLGLTATPARNTGKALSDFYEWIECMVPPSQLIAEGRLVKPDVYVPPELAKKRKRGTKIKGLAGDPVSHWKRHAEGLPTVAFCSSVEESINLCRRFNDAGIAAEYINASVSDAVGWDGKSARDGYYANLESGKTQVLCSVDLLIEGVDLPFVSAIILWRRFGSFISFIQACGRGMRPSEGKTRAVILDHAGAAGQHGLPTDDIIWSLDMGSTLSDRRKQAIKDGKLQKPIICASCGLVFSGSLFCPTCNWRVPTARTKALGGGKDAQTAKDEILVPYNGERRGELDTQAHNRQWMIALKIAIAKGGTCGMAAGIFKTQTHLLPWEADVYPLPAAGGWKNSAADEFPQFVRVKAS